MSKRNAEKEVSGLDKAISRVLEEMEQFNSNSPEYAKMVDQLEKLYKMKTSDKKEPLFSGDALLGVGANLAGIIAILSFERVHVVTTKALSFVMKAKV